MSTDVLISESRFHNRGSGFHISKPFIQGRRNVTQVSLIRDECSTPIEIKESEEMRLLSCVRKDKNSKSGCTSQTAKRTECSRENKLISTTKVHHFHIKRLFRRMISKYCVQFKSKRTTWLNKTSSSDSLWKIQANLL